MHKLPIELRGHKQRSYLRSDTWTVQSMWNWKFSAFVVFLLANLIFPFIIRFVKQIIINKWFGQLFVSTGFVVQQNQSVELYVDKMYESSNIRRKNA